MKIKKARNNEKEKKKQKNEGGTTAELESPRPGILHLFIVICPKIKDAVTKPERIVTPQIVIFRKKAANLDTQCGSNSPLSLN